MTIEPAINQIVGVTPGPQNATLRGPGRTGRVFIRPACFHIGLIIVCQSIQQRTGEHRPVKRGALRRHDRGKMQC